MKKFLLSVIPAVLIWACTERGGPNHFTSVSISDLYQDSINIRAIEFLDDNTLAFAGSNGMFGTIAINSGKVRTRQMVHDSIIPEFRAVAHTNTDFFMLSVGNPALLYKTGENGKMELVYKEEEEGVFYDAMRFWNDKEGIAIGDAMEGCLSIIITRDGGNTWKKLPCTALPPALEGEGAFAASNTNIKTVGAYTWIATSASRIFFSRDKGTTWSVGKTPMSSSSPTQGIYSIDFYGQQRGVAIGGDHTNPNANKGNKMYTADGGNFWTPIADGMEPGYRSCVQFLPNADGEGLVAVGFTGISYSSDAGNTWKELSKEGFYTIRFLNSTTAYAAGKGRISRLDFK